MDIVNVRLWHHAHVVAVRSSSWIVAFVSIAVLSVSRLRVWVACIKDCNHSFVVMPFANTKDCTIILSYLLINLTLGLLKGLDIAAC